MRFIQPPGRPTQQRHPSTITGVMEKEPRRVKQAAAKRIPSPRGRGTRIRLPKTPRCKVSRIVIFSPCNWPVLHLEFRSPREKGTDKLLAIHEKCEVMAESSTSRDDIEKSHGIKLDLISEITPRKDQSGRIIEYDFQDELDRVPGFQFSRYGGGPFCRFFIPNEYSGKSGVYFLFENSELRYIGECKDLTNRFNLGYGLIEFRNCLPDGQQTNCRLNHQILKTIKSQSKIFLYFYQTPKRKSLEDRLILSYHPAWNRTHSSRLQPNTHSRINNHHMHTPTTRRNAGGKYEKLQNLLTTCKKSELTLTFPEIETLLGFALPPSAYNHRPWWANDTSHTQAKAWLSAGWRVVSVNLGKQVKFTAEVIEI